VTIEANAGVANPGLVNPGLVNPWTTTSSHVVYENAWISVEHREVIRPDGKPGVYGVVHFRNRAAAIVPIDENGYTWLVGQFRYTTGSYSWEVPEGGVPFDEDLLAGAARELREETGITAERVIEVNRCFLSNSVTDERAYVFVATGLSFGEAEPEGTEDLQVRKVHFSEAIDMVDSGEIDDVFSIVALLTVERWQSKNPPLPQESQS
jgi:8-oxo-dGTP pyrophosphatase MutT (NUDIX family)